jgi:hypothetical protein
VLEVEGTWPNTTAEGSCSPDPGRACYRGCNPSDSNGSRFSCGCARAPSPPPSGHHRHGSHDVPCDVVGRAAIKFRYTACADGCHAPNDQWKSDLSKVIGGNWYSTTSEGDCSNPDRQRCAWSVKTISKTVNASCANGHFLLALAKRASSCLGGCSVADRADRTSTCYVTCIFQTSERFLGLAARASSIATLLRSRSLMY